MSVDLLREVILPVAFTKNGEKFVDCELDSKSAGKEHFQSNVIFLTAVVQKKNETVKLPLVIKFEPKDEVIRNELHTNIQFHNEVIMYSSVLPYIERYNICEDTFPKFYYGIGTIVDPEKDVIVLEDLSPKGFKMTNVKVFLDYQHLKLAMSKLGRFHALSYAAKRDNPVGFYKVIADLKETSWLDESSAVHPVIKHCFHRVLDPLIASGRHVDVLQRLLSRVDDNVVRFMLDLVTPQEPMAVLCHGDFCRNNILFKYDQETPTDVRFFDVATSRYSSPAVDIAFFLLMNSTRETRAKHWDDLLAAYHEALSTAAIDYQVPSLQEVKEELRLKLVYGFVHCSFFLPMMLYENTINIEDLKDVSPEKMGEAHALIGGEEGTKLLMDMVEDLLERQCLTMDHYFLKETS